MRLSYRTLFLLTVVLGAPLMGLSLAQESASGITVTGSGTAYGEPDQAVVEVGVNIVDDDLAAANDEATRLVNSLLAALGELGVAPEDIRTSQFNVWLEERYNESGEQETPRYRVNNVLSVTVRDVAQLGAVLSRSLEAGANTVGSVRFELADPSALAALARERAMADAQQKAEQLAELAGVTLGPVVMITDGAPLASPGPYPALRMEAASADVPVSGGQLSVSATVQVRFSID